MRRTLAFFVAIGAGGWMAACGSDSSGTITDSADASVEAAAPPPVPPPAPPPPPDDGGSDAADASDAADGGDASSDGGSTLDGGACDGGAVAITSVTPKFAYKDDKTAISITGAGFVATPKVYLKDASGTLTALTRFAFVSDTSITATVPSGLTAGTYSIAVVDPSGCAATFAGFSIVANPVPTVLDVSPSSGTSQADTPVTVTGCHFPSNASLSTVDASGNVVAQTTATPVVLNANDSRCGGSASYTISGTILTKTDSAQLPAGAYLVRVGNPTDATYGDWSAFVVTNPSGNLTGGWKTANGLTTGRRQLGLLAGRVDLANRFLYAIGGEDAAGKALDSVEIVPLDRFGQVGKWFTAKHALGTKRSGLAVTRQGQYLYAIGGTNTPDNGTSGAGATNPSGTPIGTIERAKILDPSGAPGAADPTTSNAAGTLAVGTYYYKVAAVLDGSDPATQGETLASDEVTASLTATGQVVLTWTVPVVGSVDHYRVYRTKKADDPSQTEVLLKDGIAAGTLTYTDTGADTPGTEVPMAIGSTGPWLDAGKALKHARLDTAAAIAPDPTQAKQYLYVIGGWGTCTTGNAAAMSCYEYAEISDDGATLGDFTDVTTGPAHARLRHGISVMTAANGPPTFTTDTGSAKTAFVVVSGGKGISGQTQTVEYALVGANGALGAFASPNGYSGERDGTQLLIADGYGYALQGGTASLYTSANTSDQSPLAKVTATTLAFTNNAGTSWPNAAANLGTKLARHAATTESAFFYMAGGTTNDTDALTSVYLILH